LIYPDILLRGLAAGYARGNGEILFLYQLLVFLALLIIES
jgi:hypothetical protein